MDFMFFPKILDRLQFNDQAILHEKIGLKIAHQFSSIPNVYRLLLFHVDTGGREFYTHRILINPHKKSRAKLAMNMIGAPKDSFRQFVDGHDSIPEPLTLNIREESSLNLVNLVNPVQNESHIGRCLHLQQRVEQFTRVAEDGFRLGVFGL